MQMCTQRLKWLKQPYAPDNPGQTEVEKELLGRQKVGGLGSEHMEYAVQHAIEHLAGEAILHEPRKS